jgi:hypothetical protein
MAKAVNLAEFLASMTCNSKIKILNVYTSWGGQDADIHPLPMILTSYLPTTDRWANLELLDIANTKITFGHLKAAMRQLEKGLVNCPQISLWRVKVSGGKLQQIVHYGNASRWSFCRRDHSTFPYDDCHPEGDLVISRMTFERDGVLGDNCRCGTPFSLCDGTGKNVEVLREVPA